MQKILYSDLNTDADKWKLYTNVLDRYLNRVREQDKPLVVPFIEKTEKNNSDIPFKEGLREDHIEMFTQKLSKSLKDKASLIYNFLLNGGELDWNSDSEIIISGNKINSSNIADLVMNAVKSKINTRPKGWNEFVSVIKDSNIPMNLFGKNITNYADSPNSKLSANVKQLTTKNTLIAESRAGRTLTQHKPYEHTWKTFKF